MAVLIALGAPDTNLAVEKELTESNLLSPPRKAKKIAKRLFSTTTSADHA